MWKQRDRGKALHARYLLTNVGGMRVDHGLDEGAPGETTDIGLLSDEVYSSTWNDYQRNRKPTSFELVGELEIVGERRSRT